MTDQPTGDASERPEDAAPTPPPPPAGGSSAPTPPASGGTSFNTASAKATLQGANRLDLGIIAAGVVAWLAGFMPFYTASLDAAGFHISGNVSAYHGFFGWFGVWCCLAGAVVAALVVGGVTLPFPAPLTVLGLFGLGTLCLILALFVFPGGGCGGVPGCDTGHGFGYWLALLCGLGGTALSFLRYQAQARPASAPA